MAKGGAGDMTDVSDWCDIKMLECAFKREVKKGEGTLTEIRKVIGQDKEVIHNMDVSYAGQCDNKPAKKMSFAKFKTKAWFMAMTNKKEAKAEALAKKIVDAEKAKQDKEATKGPAKKGSDVTSRLTDASKYTGAHKERFDAEGKGKGIDGRENRTKNTGYTGDYKGEDTFGKGGKTGGSAADDITKRLTDTKLYTGAHKERFDDDGKGKGTSGRVEKVESSGYVGNYKGKGTYDKK